MQSINHAGICTSKGCKNVQMPTRHGHTPAESSFGPRQTYAKILRKIRSDDRRTPSLIFLGPPIVIYSLVLILQDLSSVL